MSHGSRAKIRGDKQRILINPRGLTFRHRQHKAVFNKLLGHQIEFTDFGGVTAVRRQLQQAITVFGSQRLRAMEHPIFAFGLAQRVYIQHRFPVRLILAIFLQGGPSPQAAWIGLILPKVVIVLTPFGDPRNLALFIQNGQHLLFHLTKTFALGKTRGGALVFLLDPCLCGFALQLFQPQELVGGAGAPFCRHRQADTVG
ncbi:hypothetical protein D3C78_1327220 [compost metagenome]